MIQFNLLPDVKLEYIKARKLKRTVVMVSAIIGGSAFTVMVLLFLGVAVFQKSHMARVTADINTSKNKLNETQDLNKVLTIQQQLNSLPGLHEKKPVASRLFNYIQQVTPSNVTIASLDIDFSTQTIILSGAADSISTVNTFVDTLKFTKFNEADKKDDQKDAFNTVVLSSFGRDDKGSSYSITLKYDPLIFSGTSQIGNNADKNISELNVPANKITTRSETEKPLFEPLSDTKR